MTVKSGGIAGRMADKTALIPGNGKATALLFATEGVPSMLAATKSRLSSRQRAAWAPKPTPPYRMSMTKMAGRTRQSLLETDFASFRGIQSVNLDYVFMGVRVNSIPSWLYRNALSHEPSRQQQRGQRRHHQQPPHRPHEPSKTNSKGLPSSVQTAPASLPALEWSSMMARQRVSSFPLAPTRG